MQLAMDNALGDRATNKIYYDSDADQIESLPDTQPHRNIELAVLSADKAGARPYGRHGRDLTGNGQAICAHTSSHLLGSTVSHLAG